MVSDMDSAGFGEPLAYHVAISDYLKREETEVWEWYASHRVRAEQAEALRFDLLKSTYRIAREAEPTLYEAADDVADQLGLADTPITIYQAQNPQGINASLAFLPAEAHIILHGTVVATLSAAELRALLAHELGHLLLSTMGDGDLLIAEQVLTAMTHDPAADAAHIASARLFALYTEVYCDRMALHVVGRAVDVVSMLVKVTTGLPEVDAENYLEQAEEVLRQGPIATEETSHPEAFIRAHVLRQWQEHGDQATAQVEQLIEGSPGLDQLDLLGQERVTLETRHLIDLLLAPQWLRTDAVIAHARLFFDQYDLAEQKPNSEALRRAIVSADSELQDYYCYVLLDFTTADRELEEAPLAQAISVAESLGLSDRFGGLATKELRLRKKQFETIANSREQLLEVARNSRTDS